jgi:hypothetical protein
MRALTKSRLASLCVLVVAAACSAGPSDLAQGDDALSTPQSHVSMIFSSNGSYGASAPLAAGDLVEINYAASRYASCVLTRNGGPVWATVAYFMLNNGPVQSVVIAGSGAQTPSFSIPGGAGGDLAIWFHTSNDAGCNQYDSNYGQNFHFRVAAHGFAPPAWLGSDDSILTRAGCLTDDAQCDSSRRALEQGFTFDTLARSQDGYTRVELQAWQAGVTDFDNPNLWKQLDSQIHYRIGGAGAYADAYLAFDKRVGNNARYSFDLRAIDPLGAGTRLTKKSQCPAFATTLSGDKQYVQARMEFWFTVNGKSLRPSSGGNYSGTFANYAGLYAICAAAK